MVTGKVALVTGANRGLGYEICRQLCQKWDGSVILTARDKTKARDAAASLARDGLKADFLELDVTSSASVQQAAKEFQSKFQGLSILINNAGIMTTVSALKSGKQTYAGQAQDALNVNYFGVVNVCRAFFPFLTPHARVVHISSTMGDISTVLRNDLQQKFSQSQLSLDDLSELLHSYARHVKNGDHAEHGWPDQPLDSWQSSSYAVSKIGVTALASVQAREMQKDTREDILVNACCPGWLRTDMGGPNATKSVEEGAAIPIHLAFLPTDGPNGVFFRNLEVQKFLHIRDQQNAKL